MRHSPTAYNSPPPPAHHFDTPEQQYQAGKLGMWLFLATEILLFGGLFCAYAVYRANHPEIFIYAHRFLDVTWGGINTVVLICSSLTMAWAVRCAQCSQRRGLVILLALTLLGGGIFLGIKYIEYSHKWKHGLLWGTKFQPTEEHAADAPGSAEAAAPAAGNHSASKHEPSDATDRALAGTPADATQAAKLNPTGRPVGTAPGSREPERSTLAPAATGPPGLAAPAMAGDELAPDSHRIGERPSNVHIFFGIYFTMTGLHGLHVIAGMAVIAWLLARSIKGHFGRHYFSPVDLGGLYWHLVDLIWIYLFPLLYLIH